MIREGAVSTALVFEANKRHHCLYKTPFMPFQICVHTLKVDNRLLSDRYLDLDYIVEIRGAQAERTKFHIELLPSFSFEKEKEAKENAGNDITAKK